MAATRLYNSASPTAASQRYPWMQQALSSSSSAFMRHDFSLFLSSQLAHYELKEPQAYLHTDRSMRHQQTSSQEYKCKTKSSKAFNKLKII